MSNKTVLKTLSSAKEIRFFYVVFYIICLANFAYYLRGFFFLPGAVKLIFGNDPVEARPVLISRIGWFLVIGILIWLLVHIYQLIKSISRGEPFASGNPRRVRKIAHGALALATVEFLSESLRYFLGHWHWSTLKGFLFNLMGVPMWCTFFALVLLVIARVFEEGLRLKQDENLTI